MRKTSKLLSLLLAAVMMFSAFAVNSFAVATELEAGSSKNTATNIPQYGVEYVSTLSKAGETDWFKFTTLGDDAYYTVSLENYNLHNGSGERYSLNLYVFDTYGKQLVNIQGTSNISIKFENNTTYYIRVNMGEFVKDSTGNYSIRISYKLDPVPNIKDKAMFIDVNTSNRYALDGTGDIDWFVFIAPISGNYKFSLKNYNIPSVMTSEKFGINLYLQDRYGKVLDTDYCSGTFGTAEFSVVLEEGVYYYLKVAQGEYMKSYTGDYEIKVMCDSLVESNELSSISVSNKPNKTSYLIGESFDNAGLVVKANYSDGTSKTVTDYTLSGFDSSNEGTKTVTVSYTEGDITKNCTFDVTVTAESNDIGSGFFLFDWIFAFISFIINFFSSILF